MQPLKKPFLLLIILLLLTACSQSAVDIDAIPPVDRSNAVVPLDEIYFDTFRRYDRVVALTDADDELIESLRDAIPPLYAPEFERGADARWISVKDLVVGYAEGDEAYAYPIKILNWHEIASHTVGDRPIIATY